MGQLNEQIEYGLARSICRIRVSRLGEFIWVNEDKGLSDSVFCGSCEKAMHLVRAKKLILFCNGCGLRLILPKEIAMSSELLSHFRQYTFLANAPIQNICGRCFGQKQIQLVKDSKEDIGSAVNDGPPITCPRCRGTGRPSAKRKKVLH